MGNKQNAHDYIWGIFYFNPDDENLIAPKANALFGWTLNFAKPLAYIFILILLLIIILITRLFK